MFLGSELVCRLLSHAGLILGAWQTFKVLKPRRGDGGAWAGLAPIGEGGDDGTDSDGGDSGAPRRRPALGGVVGGGRAAPAGRGAGAGTGGAPSSSSSAAVSRRQSVLESSGRVIAASYDDAAGEGLLAYWAVLSALGVYEWAGEWALRWLPLYFEAKAALLLWLVGGVAAACLGVGRAPLSPHHHRGSGGGGSSGGFSLLSRSLLRGPGAPPASAPSSSQRGGGGGVTPPPPLSLDAARVLFTSLLHPAMTRVDALLDGVLAPALATVIVRVARTLTLSPHALRAAGRRGSLVPLPASERVAWRAALGSIGAAAAAEAARRGLPPLPAAPHPAPPPAAAAAASSSSSSSSSAAAPEPPARRRVPSPSFASSATVPASAPGVQPRGGGVGGGGGASSSAASAAAAQAAANDRHVSAFLASLDGGNDGRSGSGSGAVSRAGSVYSLAPCGGRYEPSIASAPLSPLAAGGSDDDDVSVLGFGGGGRHDDDTAAFLPLAGGDATSSATGTSPSNVTLRRRRTGHRSIDRYR